MQCIQPRKAYRSQGIATQSIPVLQYNGLDRKFNTRKKNIPSSYRAIREINEPPRDQRLSTQGCRPNLRVSESTAWMSESHVSAKGMTT